MIGMEALLRWQSPELGLVPPLQFIPVAEESNLIVAIGQWVLEKACATMRRWQERGVPRVPLASLSRAGSIPCPRTPRS